MCVVIATLLMCSASGFLMQYPTANVYPNNGVTWSNYDTTAQDTDMAEGLLQSDLTGASSGLQSSLYPSQNWQMTAAAQPKTSFTNQMLSTGGTSNLADQSNFLQLQQPSDFTDLSTASTQSNSMLTPAAVQQHQLADERLKQLLLNHIRNSPFHQGGQQNTGFVQPTNSNSEFSSFSTLPSDTLTQFF
ncbi:hypothetical protein Ciccas_006622 [Cichlidogyrus casuarinus]|uniref:Uncharacterized protein n=1 Tax=Cichlidogyrus casuarinus TaxID=1844966 RepID=A0ABD2Q5E7_9PLAT